MIAYLDSSVLLRLVLGQRDALKEWKEVSRGVVSALVEVECQRTLDRLRLDAARHGGWAPAHYARPIEVSAGAGRNYDNRADDGQDHTAPGAPRGYVFGIASRRFENGRRGRRRPPRT